METGHSPSPNDRQPLVVPPGQQRPDSGEYHAHTPPVAAHFPQSLHYAAAPGEHEGDIADHSAQYHEKNEHMSQAHPTHESASVQEARALDWIVPVQNGGVPERRVRPLFSRPVRLLIVA